MLFFYFVGAIWSNKCCQKLKFQKKDKKGDNLSIEGRKRVQATLLHIMVLANQASWLFH